MLIERKVTFDLTDIDVLDLRLLADGARVRFREMRQSEPIRNLTDEQVASAEGDGPTAQCRRVGELANMLEGLLAQHHEAEQAAFKARPTRPKH